MKQGHGISVCPGVVVGRAVVYGKSKNTTKHSMTSPIEERALFEAAREKAKEQLANIYNKSKGIYGESYAAIIDIQILMLDDLDFIDGVYEKIDDGMSAQEAVAETGAGMAELFSSMDDEYMQARAADIKDASDRVAGILQGEGDITLPDGKFIIIAEDLSPSQTITLPRERILAFITQKGSKHSHTAILARTLNIPAIIMSNIALDDIGPATTVAVDGYSGVWYIQPDVGVLDMLEGKRREEELEKSILDKYRGQKAFSASGKEIILLANIGSPEDVEAAIEGDAQGVGLMRSEFLFLGRKSPPGEDEQFEAYRYVANKMEGKPVTVRTLDIGADKRADYINLEAEENPALGIRGIRLCLDIPHLFKNQLRAIYRASYYGNFNILIPMITSLWELQRVKEICRDVKDELKGEHIPFADAPIGIMIETPAAALTADELASEADFFSVGTNDLIQYTLAADRQNTGLHMYHDPYHPAVKKLLSFVGKCASDWGIPACVCGEIGSDRHMIPELIKMGYSKLSMAPRNILPTRRFICESEKSENKFSDILSVRKE